MAAERNGSHERWQVSDCVRECGRGSTRIDAREHAARVAPPHTNARAEILMLYTSAMALVLLFFIVPLAIGAWLTLFVCWWGRLTPQPPCCAACGHATGDGPGMLADRCAECGCDLNAPNALVYFKRERTPLMHAGIIVGAVLATLCSLLPLASISVLFLALGRQGVLLPNPGNNAPPPAADSTSSPETPSGALEPTDNAETDQPTAEPSTQEDIR